jgi:hypothetical protein
MGGFITTNRDGAHNDESGNSGKFPKPTALNPMAVSLPLCCGIQLYDEFRIHEFGRPPFGRTQHRFSNVTVETTSTIRSPAARLARRVQMLE